MEDGGIGSTRNLSPSKQWQIHLMILELWSLEGLQLTGKVLDGKCSYLLSNPALSKVADT